jgi:general L-amino acid transport system substrate-binding protein
MTRAVALAVLVAAAVSVLAGTASAQAGDRVAAIEARGVLVCAVWPEVRGFALVAPDGSYRGFDVDMCRAVAAAILGDANRVRFVAMRTAGEFLSRPDVDMVSRRLTWSITREGVSGLRFGPVTFYDGQGFLVPVGLGVSRVDQLDGRRVCVDSGSPAEFNLGSVFRTRRLALEQVVLDAGADLAEAFRSGRCQAYTADVTMLASLRASLPDPDHYAILDEMVSKEPLAQVVRQEDGRLFDVLRWTVFSLINAEEMGLTAGNVDSSRDSDRPEVRRLLGTEPGNGRALGLREEWAYDVIRSLGNYGEIYERNLGPKTPVALARGMNRLWKDGGLMWAPPER